MSWFERHSALARIIGFLLLIASIVTFTVGKAAFSILLKNVISSLLFVGGIAMLGAGQSKNK